VLTQKQTIITAVNAGTNVQQEKHVLMGFVVRRQDWYVGFVSAETAQCLVSILYQTSNIAESAETNAAKMKYV
jgi:hypothetical protein